MEQESKEFVPLREKKKEKKEEKKRKQKLKREKREKKWLYKKVQKGKKLIVSILKILLYYGILIFLDIILIIVLIFLTSFL